MKGYLSTLILDDPSGTVPGWVMVMAETYPAALKASALVKVTWAPGPTAAVDEAQLHDRARALIADPAAGSLLDTGGRYRCSLCPCCQHDRGHLYHRYSPAFPA